jgi:hypothetical protein
MSVTISKEFFKFLIYELKNTYSKLGNVSPLRQHEAEIYEYLKNEFGTHQSNTQFMINLGHLAKLIGYNKDINPTPQSSNATTPQPPTNGEVRSSTINQVRNKNVEILPEYKNLMDDVDLLILKCEKDSKQSQYADFILDKLYNDEIGASTIKYETELRVIESCMRMLRQYRCVVKCEIEIDHLLQSLFDHDLSHLRVKVVEVVNPPYEIPTITYNYVKM